MDKLHFWLLSLLLLFFAASCHYKIGTKLPDKQFMFIDKTYQVEVCNLLAGKCIEDEASSSGSGVLIAHSDNKDASYVLTVAHLCVDPNPQLPFFVTLDIKSTKMVIKEADGHSHDGDEGEHVHEATVEAMDLYNDLCLIKTEYLEHRNPMKLARRAPKKHKRLWNLAAPHGIWSEDNSLWFEGYFTGYTKIDRKVLDLPPGWKKTECNLKDESKCLDDEWSVATYTIPAAPGSSGSPVFNERGELVGILSMVIRPDYHISLGPTHEQIKDFLDEHMP